MTVLKDAWLYAKPAAWDALDPGPEEDWPHAGFSRYTYSQARTGFWKSYQTDYEVYNLLCTEAEFDAIVAALGPDNAQKFTWDQGSGLDSPVGQTIPAEVLAVMPDHIIYDVDGNPTGSTAATYSNPNWRHVFVDQQPRIFAGEFSYEFSEEFF